jgi:hypothetical protein
MFTTRLLVSLFEFVLSVVMSGLVLSSVVLVAALYVSEGVSAISKALVPQPSIGRIEIMK